MINAVLNEGVKGMQTSQREMLKSAQDIASFNIREEKPLGGSTEADTTILPVNKADESARPGNIAEPIVELRRQELMFTASAKVVEAADQSLGSLLDVHS